MWGSFFLAALACAVFLYLPSYLVLRGFRAGRLASVCCAPFVAVALYAVLCVIYGKLGIPASWISLAVPVAVLGVALIVVFRLLGKTSALSFGLSEGTASSVRALDRRRDWIQLAVYAGVGIVLVGLFFVRNLDGAGSFVQEFDNVHHINTIRAFVDSGNWSSLSTTVYPLDATTFPPPETGSKFYPAAWHCIAALLVDALGVPVTVAANATNFVFAALVFPSGMFLLMRKVFTEPPRVVLLGAFCTLAFAAFPWKLLAWGPIYPNFAALALLPSVLFCFMVACSSGLSRSARVVSGVLFVVGMAGLALTQPNAVFTAAVFLIPFCVYRIAQYCDAGSGDSVRSRKRKILLCSLFVVFALVVWAALFCSPFLEAVTSFTWPAFAGKAQALVNLLCLSFRETSAQLVLGVLVIAGAFYTFFHRKYLWITCSYALMGIMYLVNVSTDGMLKQFLTGFWYADPMRLGANIVIVGIPLAALGLWCAARGVKRAYLALSKRTERPKTACLATGVTVAAFAVLVFYPNYTIPGNVAVSTAFGQTGEFLARSYDASASNVYDADEQAFVEAALDVIPEGAVVLNEPNDGSAFAYGVNELNVYYRGMGSYGGENESAESRAIREGLCDIANSEQVAAAVDAVGADYVLLLDQGDKAQKSRYFFSYKPDEWAGVDAIDDATPGFEVVLSQGDMRLYRITR